MHAWSNQGEPSPESRSAPIPRSGAGERAASPLRLIVFDATDTAPITIPRIERRADGTAHGTGGLTRFWRMGAALHRVVTRADAALGATSWSEALRWAAETAATTRRPIGEIQAWGHGGWGYMGMGKERLDAAALKPTGRLATEIDALRAALAGDALLWLRCCSAFGNLEGRDFASALADRLGTRVAGHTFIIGAWQSGTRSLGPGERPRWSVGEGVEKRPHGAVALTSSPMAPRTVTCLHLGLPAGY